MLASKLDQGVASLENFSEIKLQSESKKNQIKLESEFQNLIDKFEILILLIGDIVGSTDFKPSYRVTSDIRSIISSIETSYDMGLSSKEINKAIKLNTNRVEETLKEEWMAFHRENTSLLLSMLRTILKITPDREYTQRIINKLDKVKFFSTDKQSYELFASGIDEGNKLIQSLDLNKPIIEFLESVSKGNVTLSDLTPEIMEWIKKEGISSNFMLSFVNKEGFGR